MKDKAGNWSEEVKIDTYRVLPDVIEKTDGVQKPEGYHEVSFVAGEHGTMESGAKATYYVRGGKALNLTSYAPPKTVKNGAGEVTTLGVTPHVGYQFAGSWTQGTEAANLAAVTVTEDTAFTAVMTKTADIIAKTGDQVKPEGYVTVTFLPQGKGTTTGALVYYVNPEADVALGSGNMPTVTAHAGTSFVGWSMKSDTDPATYSTLETLTETKASYGDDEDYQFTATTKIKYDATVYATTMTDFFTIRLHRNTAAGDTEVYDVNVTKAMFDAKAKKITLPQAYENSTQAAELSVFKKADHTFVGWHVTADDMVVSAPLIYPDATGASDADKVAWTYAHKAIKFGDIGTGTGKTERLLDCTTIDFSATDFETLVQDHKVIDYYALYKPFYTITATKAFGDKSGSGFTANASYNRPVDVGLLYRTAVTAYTDPTVLAAANYYLPKDSLGQTVTDVIDAANRTAGRSDYVILKHYDPANPTASEALTWKVPGYDDQGLRLSYITVEMTPDESATYYGFKQHWPDLNITIHDRLPDQTYDDENYQAKTQIVSLSSGTAVDTFSGATTRQATKESLGGGQQVTGYTFTIQNEKLSLPTPSLKPVYGGDSAFTLLDFDGSATGTHKDVKKITLTYTPDGGTPAVETFTKGPSGWTGSGGFTIVYNEDDHTVTITKPSGESFVVNDQIKIQYSDNGSPEVTSEKSEITVLQRQPSGKVTDIKQQPLVEESGEEYVLITAQRPSGGAAEPSGETQYVMYKKGSGTAFEELKDGENSIFVYPTQGDKTLTYKVKKSLLTNGDVIKIEAREPDKTPAMSDDSETLDLLPPGVEGDFAPRVGENKQFLYFDLVITDAGNHMDGAERPQLVLQHGEDTTGPDPEAKWEKQADGKWHYISSQYFPATTGGTFQLTMQDSLCNKTSSPLTYDYTYQATDIDTVKLYRPLAGSNYVYVYAEKAANLTVGYISEGTDEHTDVTMSAGETKKVSLPSSHTLLANDKVYVYGTNTDGSSRILKTIVQDLSAMKFSFRSARPHTLDVDVKLTTHDFDWAVVENKIQVELSYSTAENLGGDTLASKLTFDAAQDGKTQSETIRVPDLPADQIIPHANILQFNTDEWKDKATYVVKSATIEEDQKLLIELDVYQFANNAVTVTWKNEDGTWMAPDADTMPESSSLENQAKVKLAGADYTFTLPANGTTSGTPGKVTLPGTPDREKFFHQAGDGVTITGESDGVVTLDGKQYVVTKRYTPSEGTQITLQYAPDIIARTDTTTPVPAGYVRVVFDENGGTLSPADATKIFDVRIAANKTLGDLAKPTVNGAEEAGKLHLFKEWQHNQTKAEDSLALTLEQATSGVITLKAAFTTLTMDIRKVTNPAQLSEADKTAVQGNIHVPTGVTLEDLTIKDDGSATFTYGGTTHTISRELLIKPTDVVVDHAFEGSQQIDVVAPKATDVELTIPLKDDGIYTVKLKYDGSSVTIDQVTKDGNVVDDHGFTLTSVASDPGLYFKVTLPEGKVLGPKDTPMPAKASDTTNGVTVTGDPSLTKVDAPKGNVIVNPGTDDPLHGYVRLIFSAKEGTLTGSLYVDGKEETGITRILDVKVGAPWSDVKPEVPVARGPESYRWTAWYVGDDHDANVPTEGNVTASDGKTYVAHYELLPEKLVNDWTEDTPEEHAVYALAKDKAGFNHLDRDYYTICFYAVDQSVDPEIPGKIGDEADAKAVRDIFLRKDKADSTTEPFQWDDASLSIPTTATATDETKTFVAWRKCTGSEGTMTDETLPTSGAIEIPEGLVMDAYKYMFMAKYGEKATVIIPDDPTTPTPTGYHKVTFAKGTDGNFGATDKTVFFVLDGKTISDAMSAEPALVIPTATPTDTAKSHAAWGIGTQEYKKDLSNHTDDIEDDITFTAIYKDKVIVIDTNGGATPLPEGYVRLLFDATENGSIQSDNRYKVIDVLEGTKWNDTNLTAEIPSEATHDDNSYAFDKWMDSNGAAPLAGEDQVVEANEYEAHYKKTQASLFTPTNPTKTPVVDKTALTAEEKTAVETAVRTANPTLPEETTVAVDNDGKVTITYPDHSVDTIEATLTVNEKPKVTVANMYIWLRQEISLLVNATDDGSIAGAELWKPNIANGAYTPLSGLSFSVQSGQLYYGGTRMGTTAGRYSFRAKVTDNEDAFTYSNAYYLYVMDAAGGTITKPWDQDVTEAEILNKVTINSGATTPVPADKITKEIVTASLPKYDPAHPNAEYTVKVKLTVRDDERDLDIVRTELVDVIVKYTPPAVIPGTTGDTNPDPTNYVKVTMDANGTNYTGATLTGTPHYWVMKNHTLTAADVAGTTASYTGAFKEWTLTAAKGSTDKLPQDVGTTDKTLYAQYTADVLVDPDTPPATGYVKVTFNAVNGSDSGTVNSKASIDVYVKNGTKWNDAAFTSAVSGLTVVAPTGKSFTEWKDGTGNAIPTAATAISASTYIAQYTTAPVPPVPPTPVDPAEDDNQAPVYWDSGWFFGIKEETKPEVHKGTHIWYIQGYPDGTVHPDGYITRAEAAAMIARLEGMDLSMKEAPHFPDTPSNWYNSVINAVVAKGLMQGYPDGTFKPNGPITRGEFAKTILLLDAKNLAGSLPFSDVSDHWAKEAIHNAYANGRIAGYEDGTFRPNQPITRAEAAKMLNSLYHRGVLDPGLGHVHPYVRAFSDLTPDHWAYFELIEASHTHRYENAFEARELEDWMEIKY